MVTLVLKSATGSSHAKIILIGEHSVVYNQPAIALPLTNLELQAEIKQRNFGQLILSENYQGQLTDLAEVYEGIRQLINRLLQHFNAQNLAFSLKITSNIPQERGMGASAASAVAIVRAFFAFFEQPLTDQELQRWASIEEIITHGSPSGIDAATTTYTNPVWFVKGQNPIPINMNMAATLIIADTGVHGQTGLAISVVREQLQNEPLTTQTHLNMLGELTHQARETLATNDKVSLGRLMSQAQQHLSALDVSHPQLDNLVSAALEAGALGAKLTGGGVGGAMLALADTPASAKKIIAALEKAGAREIWSQTYQQS